MCLLCVVHSVYMRRLATKFCLINSFHRTLTDVCDRTNFSITQLETQKYKASAARLRQFFSCQTSRFVSGKFTTARV